mmetsp:Transcript_89767/g.187552  ORF Transcript_89767/g.187552 Transcript_89767/m.187552 type:complete len:946 (+) Transcript_89767:83-2920(+)
MVRVVFVSNRLPVTINPDRQPPHDVQQSSGGLVSALRSVAQDYDEVLWIGWPGAHCANEEEMTRRLHESSSAIQMHPVWLSKDDVEDFYNGFSNSSLWPLLHWMTPYARFKRSWFESYRRVNTKFAEVILAVARPDDIVWVHDYHLFLVPQMVRKIVQELQEGGYELPDRPKDLPIEDAEDDSKEFLRYSSFESIGSSSAIAAAAAAGAAVTPTDATPSAAAKDSRRVSFSPAPRGQDPRWHSLKIGFFLHTPFPSWEVISTHPNVVDIVQGMLGADLIGFHTYNYLRHYRSCVIRLCGFTPEMDMVEFEGRRSRLGVYPIGANCSDILNNMKTDKFKEHLTEYADQFQGKSLVLSVERLDYSKGMPQKLAAIEKYLEEAAELQKARKTKGEDESDSQDNDEREQKLEQLKQRFEERRVKQKESARGGLRTAMSHFWNKAKSVMLDQEEDLDHTKTVFLFIAVPSRQSVQEYKAIEEEVHKSISTINGRFGTVNHTPILYIHRSISGDELAALYARADCCLVTPLVDGMNLVAKEFLVAKDREVDKVVPGTVVLSEFAGATQELFDALVVNPYDVEAVADAIHLGLELTRGDGVDRQYRWEVSERMRASVLANDAVSWAGTILKDLQEDKNIGLIDQPTKGPAKVLGMFAKDFSASNSGRKAIVLNFDGCKDTVPPDPKIWNPLLESLSARSDIYMTIISGRNKEFMEEKFGKLSNVALIAEHGIFVRRPSEKHWSELFYDDSRAWLQKVTPLMQLFERCTPHAKLDIRRASLAWYFGDCDEIYGTFKTKELVHQLALSTGNLPCEVCQGEKFIEVKSLRVANGFALKKIVAEQDKLGSPLTAILIVSDDSSDPSIFQALPKDRAYTIRVGLGDTCARHRFEDWNEGYQFLNTIDADDPDGFDKAMSFQRFQSCLGDESALPQVDSDEAGKDADIIFDEIGTEES